MLDKEIEIRLNAWFEKVNSRPEDFVTKWLENVTRSIIRIDGAVKVEENVSYLLSVLQKEDNHEKL